jgi:hypothetical protein
VNLWHLHENLKIKIVIHAHMPWLLCEKWAKLQGGVKNIYREKDLQKSQGMRNFKSF